MNADKENKTQQEIEEKPKTNESTEVAIQDYLKISDPESGEVYLNQRG